MAGQIDKSFAAPACGGGAEFVVRGTEKSVGVDGVIQITHQQEDVNLVTVDLVNLPPAERHERSKKYFIVWLTPADGQVIKAGRQSRPELTSALHRLSPRGELQERTLTVAQLVAELGPDVVKDLLPLSEPG